MPNGTDPGQEPGAFLTHGIMAARPRIFGSAITGAGWGAGIGAMAGGMPGAAVGAGIGIALGTLTSAATRLATAWRGLERTSRSLVERFKDINPAMARMRGQWEQLDRQLNRAWARTIAPILQHVTNIAADFKLRWNKMKMEFFEAIAPHLEQLLSLVTFVGEVGLKVARTFFDILSRVIEKITSLLDLLGLLTPPGKRKPGVMELIPTEFPWAAEGPVAAQMFRRGEVGRFARRRGFPGPEGEEEEEEGTEKEPRGGPALIEKTVGPYAEEFWKYIFEVIKRHGERRRQPREGLFLPKEEKTPGVSVNINVRDSAELASAVERVVAQAVGELRRIEAESSFVSYQLRETGTYA